MAFDDRLWSRLRLKAPILNSRQREEGARPVLRYLLRTLGKGLGAVSEGGGRARRAGLALSFRTQCGPTAARAAFAFTIQLESKLGEQPHLAAMCHAPGRRLARHGS